MTTRIFHSTGVVATWDKDVLVVGIPNGPVVVVRRYDRRVRAWLVQLARAISSAWHQLVRPIEVWQEQRAWRQLRALPCGGKHSTSVNGDGTCDACHPLYERVYPQGWSYYPGDVCEHGRYVGGCGADYMCPACEGGY